MTIPHYDDEDKAALSDVKVLQGAFFISEDPGEEKACADITITSVEIIGEEAFAGIAAASVLVGENVCAIGEKAFADCVNLTALFICGAETDIDDTALSGSGNVTVYAPADSKAQAFAQANGITFVPLV